MNVHLFANRSAFVLFVSAILFAGASSPASAETVNDPKTLHPIMRSWMFTEKDDQVIYHVLGYEEWNRERWTSLGTKDGVYYYAVEKFKNRDRISSPSIAKFSNYNPEISERRMGDFFEREGWRVTRETRQVGDVQFPCLRLDHDTKGSYIYSEDIPMGGVVKKTDYDSGVQYELEKFVSHTDPAPSRRLIEIESSGSISGIVQRGSQGDGKADKLLPKVIEGDPILREDADSTPPYFIPKGEPSNYFTGRGWLPEQRIGRPVSRGKWSVEYFDDINDDAPLFSYTQIAQHEGVMKDGRVKTTLEIEDIGGKAPSDLLEGRTGKYFSPDVPLIAENEYRVFRREGRDFKIRNVNYHTMGYTVYEGPIIRREETEDGGEKQHVVRILHNYYIAPDVGGAPLLVAHEATIYEYQHTADAEGKIIEDSVVRKASRKRELMTQLYLNMTQEQLAVFSAPAQ